MTTKELINQYVTAHADNRWMDASELEALLTEFAEKLKEPTLNRADIINSEQYKVSRASVDWYQSHQDADCLDGFEAGAQWYKEELMKDAIDTRIDKRLADMIGYTGSDKVKIIIIKE